MKLINPTEIEIEQIEKPKKAEPIFNTELSEELIAAISQYKTLDYTLRALMILKEEAVPFTSLVLFDGLTVQFNKPDTFQNAPIRTKISKNYLDLLTLVDISINLKNGIHSLPHIWNLMFGAAKLTKAKYLYWQGSDMEIMPGSLKSMMRYIEKFDIVNPVKIDKDREKFNNYKPIYDKPKLIAGINDSAALFKLDKLPFFPFDYEYAPYQFETSALGYKLWRAGCKSILDPEAVIFHHVSKDIEHSPTEREIGSSTWDKKKDIFLKKDNEKQGYIDNEKKFFLEQSIMNSDIANIIGFPCYIYGDIK